MIEVLLVDDDLESLEDLRQLLFMSGAEWQVSTAGSAEDALRHLATGVIDVVVTDLKMPGTDGAELLSMVRDQFPSVMRVLMSGNADVSFTAQLVPQAHQFLLKPIDVTTLRSTVERAYELGTRLGSAELRDTLNHVTELPRPPQSVLKLNSLLESADAGTAEIAAVVERDMALTAKLFQLVNSAYYGMSRSIQDIREAIAYLGVNTVRNIAVSIEVQRTLSAVPGLYAEEIQEIHDRGNEVAQIARQLVLVREQANEAFVAGLLHDVGLLTVISYLPERYAELRDAAQRTNLPIGDLELEIIGAHHSDLGAYLLELWGLQFPIVEAVARHHDAELIPDRRMDAAHAVHIASAIVESQRDSKVFARPMSNSLDTAYLKELGVLERVAGLLAVSADA